MFSRSMESTGINMITRDGSFSGLRSPTSYGSWVLRGLTQFNAAS